MAWHFASALNPWLSLASPSTPRLHRLFYAGSLGSEAIPRHMLCSLPSIPPLPPPLPREPVEVENPFVRGMGSLRSRVESWIKNQTARIGVACLPSPPQWRWPPWKGRHDRRDQERRLREEFERRLLNLCRAVKADSVADLQEILCSMVLSECVYKVGLTPWIQSFLLFSVLWNLVSIYLYKICCFFVFISLRIVVLRWMMLVVFFVGHVS